MTVSTNPSYRWCWSTCSACYRCKDKGRYSQCSNCSGRHDPHLYSEPDPDDFCVCGEGILRWRARDGRLVIRKYSSNPFETKVVTEKKTEDERDWEAYLMDVRERMDNPNWDPIQITDVKPKGDPFRDGFKYLGAD